MTGLWIFTGVVLGGLGVWAYDRYFSSVYMLGVELYKRAQGDIEKAWTHVRKLVP